MTGVPVSAEGPSHPSPESASDLLKRAASLIESRESLAVIGPWSTNADKVTGGPEEEWLIADAHTSTTAAWIAMMSPTVADPLAAWLRAEARFVRRVYTAMHGQVEHLPSLRFARQVLGETS